MKAGNAISDQTRRANARRTALIFGAIALAIYATAIVSVVWPR
jgi:hypothetical protein